jgi:hypothetical protein
MAAATSQQLTSLLDLDLWRHAQPGRDEQFDADRFGEWLEVLVDNGEAVAARIVAALDEHLVVAGLSRYIRVFDPGAVAQPPSIDDDARIADGQPETADCEVGGYLVRALRPDAWDAVTAVLHALDADHPDCFTAVMRGCRALSNSTPEIDGLDELLMEPAQWMHDVALDREHRRSLQGYSTPADARAFLEVARRPREGALRVNPVAAAYFRAADDSTADQGAPLPPQRTAAGTTDGSTSEALHTLAGLLAEAGLVPQRTAALIEGAGSQGSTIPRMQSLMRHVRDGDDDAYFARSRELAFLANTLVAGCSVQSRPFTPAEASQCAVSICNLGLEYWPERWEDAERSAAPSNKLVGAELPEDFLVGHDLVTAFEAGWKVLHQDVSMFVASSLIDTVSDLHCADEAIQDDLNDLRRELTRERDAGTPWRARGALEVLAMLDTPAWASVTGLLSECPVLPKVLIATLERKTGAVSATAFEFFSTRDQVEKVHAFMATLLDTLSR